MLVLTIPWILLLLFVFICLLLFFRKWKCTLAVVLVWLIINSWFKCFSLNWRVPEKGIDSRQIKVLAFNVDGKNGKLMHKSDKLLYLLNRISPDIIFFSEFGETEVLSVDSLLRKTYPYTTFDLKGYNHYFYSKFPIISHVKLRSYDDCVLRVYTCKIKIDTDTIGLIGCHLASNNYPYDMPVMNADSIHTVSDFESYMYNIDAAYKRRHKDAMEICENIRQTPYPIILLGDINDVCGSATIRTIEKEGLKDAWWEGGFGYGATIHKPVPYRIDHIFYSKEFGLQSVKVIESGGISDHDAIFAQFSM